MKVPARWQRLQCLLFFLTGVALPFYAFPVGKLFGKPVDLATIFGALFVLVSLPGLMGGRAGPGSWIFFGAAVVVPLLALVSPSSSLFDGRQFAISYGHWLLVASFFLSALSLRLSERDRSRLATGNVTMGVLVALFGLYQVVGIPRGWPGTGSILFSFQREPLRLSSVGGYTRPTSFFLEPAWMGGYLAWVLALVLSWRTQPTGQRPRLAWRFGVSLLLVGAILASVSWGAFLDLGVVLVASLASSRAARTLRFRTALPFLLVAAGLLALAGLSAPGRGVREAVAQRWRMLRQTPTTISAPPSQIQDSSWVRLRNAEYALSLWKSHPLGGVGLGQFRRHARKVPTPLQAITQHEPWFGWLAIAAEMGTFGPIALAAALVLVLRRFRCWASGSFRFAVPVLVSLAVVQQSHTGSYIDLWWWYPVSLAGVFSAGSVTSPERRPS